GIGRYFDLQGFNGRSVRLEPSVDPVGLSDPQQEDGHPKIGHQNIDQDHAPIFFGIVLEHLQHRRLVGPAPDPAARNGGQSPPYGIKTISPDGFRGKNGDDQNGNGPPDDYSDGTGQEHDHGLGPQG